VEFDSLLCDALEITKHEVNTPMILLGGQKMSKTDMALVSWQALTCVSSLQARRFLVATALYPTDAVRAALEIPDIEGLVTMNLDSSVPYIWSWKNWGEYVGRCRT
jgi:hypothetical protein